LKFVEHKRRESNLKFEVEKRARVNGNCASETLILRLGNNYKKNSPQQRRPLPKAESRS